MQRPSPASASRARGGCAFSAASTLPSCVPAPLRYVIAIGAEIPDTIQSVTVAKRGYGSMAVSNSTGSQATTQRDHAARPRSAARA
eukprot:2565292-Pleurochrysis_carterae.AAC.1